MKFLRYGPKGQEKPGCLDAQGRIRDLSGETADFQGAAVSVEALQKLAKLDPESLPPVEGEPRIGAALADVPNFYCIGLNYARHAAESGMEVPAEPVIFSKGSSALSGPYDDVIIPKGSVKTDWEVELAVVIGKAGNHVPEVEALDYVSAYCIVNDVSERTFQLERGGQWIKGKSAPSFGPTGPWLVTPDEVGDPQQLRLKLSIDGQVQQDSSTSDMIFTVARCISAVSEYMALRPGDIIATGTPEGVGMGQKPQRWLQPGEVMELTIDKLGTQRQKAVAFPG
jgi:2-keto-4-pentenoate hydratase/2-oxohepta-3-ene-1,7-dioic acid hydratase in catechol pathway